MKTKTILFSVGFSGSSFFKKQTKPNKQRPPHQKKTQMNKQAKPKPPTKTKTTFQFLFQFSTENDSFFFFQSAHRSSQYRYSFCCSLQHLRYKFRCWTALFPFDLLLPSAVSVHTCSSAVAFHTVVLFPQVLCIP